MTNKIKNIEVNNNIVELCDNYPTSKLVPNEKIMFRDLPFSVKDSAILQYLEKQKGITVKTGVIHSRIRDQQNKLTRFCSGDRFVYVKGQFSHALHTTAMVESHRCRILHKSQFDACIRCPETRI